MKATNTLTWLRQRSWDVHDEKQAFVADHPSVRSRPVFYDTGQGSLLFWVYSISRWMTNETHVSSTFRTYADPFFARLDAFWFNAEFLDVVCTDPAAEQTARESFSRAGNRRIEDLYADACNAIGFTAAN